MRFLPLLLILAALICCDRPLTDDDLPDGSGTDSTEIVIRDDIADTVPLSVTQARAFWQSGHNNPVTVEAYIVGCAAGSAISSAVFEPPFPTSSNLLLADDSVERTASLCFPVSLKSGSEIRAALGLAVHPELLCRRLRVHGALSTYFGGAGMRDVVWWQLLSRDSEADDDGGADGDGDVVLRVDSASVYVSGGRGVKGR